MTTLWDRWRAPRPAAPVAVVNAGEIRAKVDDAYNKGRHDEAKRHRSHPILMFALLLVAAVGAVSVYYAVREGSFSRGGAVVDGKLAVAASSAGPALVQAAATAVPKVEQAATKAGETINADGQALSDKTKALADKPAKPNP
jgi:hypothetical protein